MKNYKVNIDKTPPSQEEILAGKNFDALMARYKAAPGKVVKKPFWKSGVFAGAMAAAAVIAVGVWLYTGKDDSITPDQPVIAQGANTRMPDSVSAGTWTPTKRKVSPPLAGLDVSFTSYKIDARKGGTLSHFSGSRVTFQPGSFVDAGGKEIRGNVEVRYREMRDAAEIFLSGIPMQYDSAGQTWNFESAGMMEIAAFVNGEVVYLKEDKPMKVEMVSHSSDSRFNVYQFDTVQGNWVYKGKDAVSERSLENNSQQQQHTQNPATVSAPPKPEYWVDSLTSALQEPLKPRQVDPSKNRFTVDFNRNEFPEMEGFRNVIFEVDETKEKFDRNNYNIVWQTIQLSRGEGPNKYQITLKKGLKSLVLDVYPVLQEKDYEVAMKDYETKLAEFEKARKDAEAWKAQASNMQAGQVTSSAQVTYTMSEQQRVNMELYGNVMRTFTASSFGIYNMDCVLKYIQGVQIELSVQDEKGRDFKGFCMYHVDKSKLALITYFNDNPIHQFHYNPSGSNLIWAVRDGKLFYAMQEEFSSLPDNGKGTLSLKESTRTFANPDEMKQFFGLASTTSGQ